MKEKLIKLWNDYGKKIILIAIAGIGFYLITTHFEAYSNYANAMLLIVSAGLLFYLFDKWVLHGFDTIEEIKNRNIAAAILVLAYSIVVGSAIIAAFK